MTLAFTLKFGLTVSVIGALWALIKNQSKSQALGVLFVGFILTLIMAINSNG